MMRRQGTVCSLRFLIGFFSLVVAFIHLQILSNPAKSGLKPWIEEKFEDFLDGTFDSSGANLYVSAQGTLQLINRWDVNQDGYIDLIFPSTHDTKYTEPAWIYYQGRKEPVALPSLGGFRIAASDVNKDGYLDLILGNFDNNVSEHNRSFVYWGSGQGFSSERRLELWTEGVSGIAIGDLNRDGHPEVIFANEASNISFIYWGGPEGLSSVDRTDLPTAQAKAVTVADLNSDNFPDLIFANGSDRGGGSFIYWGGPQGIAGSAPTILETRQSVGVAADDLNRDGYVDLVFANLGPDKNSMADAYVYWGSSHKYSNGLRSSLPLSGASGVAVADVDGNGYVDLVFPCGMSGERTYGVREYRDRQGITGDPPSSIYWGGSGGYNSERRTLVPTLGATASSIADYDGDGRLDVAFSQLRDQQQFETDSLVFRNSSSGLDLKNPLRFKTRGATDVLLADLDRDGKCDLTFANKVSGNAAGTAPSYLYWGSKDGYSLSRRLELPSSGANEAKIADFNDDGWTDLLICNQDHEDRTAKTGASIFWGGPTGISPRNASVVDVDRPLGSAVADFNRDGYLDIVFSCWDELKDALFIYWGGSDGYSKKRRTALPHRDGRAVAIGDVNRDSYLDIIATSVLESNAKVFWGGSDGFSRGRFQTLSGLWPVSAEVADLNNDGYLEVVLCNLQMPGKKDFEVPSYIYWGGDSGLTENRRTELPTSGAHDVAVVDMNKDGHLDLIFSNYRTNFSRERSPAFVYWGSRAGFDSRHRSLLPARGAAGMLAADLDHDGIWDFVFANHVNDEGNHRTDSMILWGTTQGHHGTKVTWLPTLGCHNMLTVDVGNRTTRELQEEYVSSVHQVAGKLSKISLSWEAETPPGTRLRFQIRTADSPAALHKAGWRGPQGMGGFFEASAASPLLANTEQTWVQYRALFQTDGGNSPRLRRVEMHLQ